MKNEVIIVERGEQTALAELFSVSRPTVRVALKGIRTSLKTAKIRQAAIERGGVYKSQLPKF